MNAGKKKDEMQDLLGLFDDENDRRFAFEDNDLPPVFGDEKALVVQNKAIEMVSDEPFGEFERDEREAMLPIFVEKIDSSSDAEYPLDLKTGTTGEDLPPVFDDWEDIEQRIKSDRNDYRQGLYGLTRKDYYPYEQFLILQLIAKVSYLTRSQTLRFLEAWQKFFEPDVMLNENILRHLSKRGWIEQIKTPLEFKKGKLKGKKVQPFYLTAQGRKVLSKCSPDLAEAARFGEPKAKMVERLRHELLISEVFVHLVEQKNYVYWIMTDEDLRREQVKRFIERTRLRLLGKRLGKERGSIGDFRICYYDAEKEEMMMRDGEVAVRYTGDQILSKDKNLWWFCYDEKEAKKIKFLTGEKATVLDVNHLTEYKVRGAKARIGRQKNAELMAQWLDFLGGLTIQTAAIVGEVHYNTANNYLQSRKELAATYETLEPGMGLGRGVRLYVKEELTRDETAHQRCFVMNQTIHALYELGYRMRLDGEAIKAEHEKRETVFRLSFDAEYYNPAIGEDGTLDKLREQIKQAADEKEEIILGVGNGGNCDSYQAAFPQLVCINLKNHQFKYRN